MINGRNFFDQPIKNDLKTYDNIRKIKKSRQWLHDRMFIRLSLFQKYYKLITIDLSKQRKLNADPKPIQQINFTGNLDS